jgi:hypothetical protein
VLCSTTTIAPEPDAAVRPNQPKRHHHLGRKYQRDGPRGQDVSQGPMALVVGDFVAADGDQNVKLGLRRDTTVFPWGGVSAHYGDGFTLGIAGSGSQDPDNDGLTTAQEWALGADPLDPDSNDDGILDGAAVQAGISPTNLDMDADGVVNQTETRTAPIPSAPTRTKTGSRTERTATRSTRPARPARHPIPTTRRHPGSR